MTPRQIATLSTLHKGHTETVTVARAYGKPGSILVTYWLLSGAFREVTINPEGGTEYG